MVNKPFTTLNQLRQKRDEIYTIAAKYGVSNIRVFGSVARGEENENSDVDLLTTLNPNVSFFGLVKLEMLLENSLGRRIQIISDKAINKHLKSRVLKEAVLI